jgi:glycine/D-amino acid oxidase-like deaminating enzyme
MPTEAISPGAAVSATLERREYDVIVVGSGGAGAAVAHTAVTQGARVLVVSKDPIVCYDSKIAEGIVTVILLIPMRGCVNWVSSRR